MTSFLKKFFSVSLILLFSIACSASNNLEAEPLSDFNELSIKGTSLNASSILLSSNTYPLVSYSSNDGFFSRLFGRKRTVAERRSQSQAHPTSRRQRYRPPRSNSQVPVGGSSISAPSSSENAAVQNVQKEPLTVSRRDQLMQRQREMNWQFGLSLGSAHAVAGIGDSKNMGFGDFISYQSSNLGLNFGAFAKYKFYPWLAVSFGMDYGSYQGLHGVAGCEFDGWRFKNNVFEFFAKSEFAPPFLSESPFDVYLFGGVGVFFNDISLFNELNRKVSLEMDYNQVQPAFPLGIGFGYTVNNQLRIGYELGYRYTMFNHFDGVTRLSDSNDKYFSNALKVSFYF